MSEEILRTLKELEAKPKAGRLIGATSMVKTAPDGRDRSVVAIEVWMEDGSTARDFIPTAPSSAKLREWQAAVQRIGGSEALVAGAFIWESRHHQRGNQGEFSFNLLMPVEPGGEMPVETEDMELYTKLVMLTGGQVNPEVPFIVTDDMGPDIAEGMPALFKRFGGSILSWIRRLHVLGLLQARPDPESGGIAIIKLYA